MKLRKLKIEETHQSFFVVQKLKERENSVSCEGQCYALQKSLVSQINDHSLPHEDTVNTSSSSVITKTRNDPKPPETTQNQAKPAETIPSLTETSENKPLQPKSCSCDH